jgi:hypothetical protein
VTEDACTVCGGPLPAYSGRGRPRRFCLSCATSATAARVWRAENPERVTAYNSARRRGPVELRCIECGGPFTSRLATALTCSHRCRRQRKYRHERERTRE